MSQANVRYDKFLVDVERDVKKTLDKNLQLLYQMKPAVTGDDYSLDWIAPSVQIVKNLTDLAGDLGVHWRNYAVNAARD